VNGPAAFRPPAAYIHGVAGPCVILPARIAAWLESHAEINQIRLEARGVDPEVDAVLNAIRVAAMAWRTSATGTPHAAEPEEMSESLWMSTTTAADKLDMTDRGIRQAIRENRLRATNVSGRWRINEEDLEHYRTARAA
jgi:excisionase family DNA binding protein